MTTLDVVSELVDLARRVFAGADTDGSGFDRRLWADLQETGLARLSLPEEAGGSGGTVADLAAVLVEAGAAAARVPLAETDLLGGWLAHGAGLAVPDGPLTVGVAGLDLGSGTVSGAVPDVAWARECAAVLVLSGTDVIRLDPGTFQVRARVNLADEPRDTLVLDAVPIPADAVAQAPGGVVAELRLRAALGRALLLCGAARSAVAAGVRYAGEREQFGRPIGRFQAVQQQLALAGAELAAATAAAEAAARAATTAGFGSAATAVAIAKGRASEAAGVVARIVHQVHGAIGVTREHPLRLSTTRLWAWRDEDGSEADWYGELGDRALAAGTAGLWPLIVGE